MIGPKATKNFLETIGGQCSILGKALGCATVKCKCNGDQISRMNPYMEMNKLETKRLKYT